MYLAEKRKTSSENAVDAKKRVADVPSDSITSERHVTAPHTKKSVPELKAGRYFPKVLCFGDSMTQRGHEEGGWCNILGSSWRRKCDVVNRGFSGYTSRMWRYITDNVLSYDNQPTGIIAFVIILLGTNDAANPSIDKRGVPVEEYSSSIADVINTIRDHGINVEQVVLLSPPPVYIEDWERFCKSNGYMQALSDDVMQQYAMECEKLASRLGVWNINIWELMHKEEDWNKYLEDGVHFSKEGHQFLANELIKEIGPTIDNFATVYPLWRDIDPANPEPMLS